MLLMDPGNKDKHNFTNLLWIQCMEFKKLLLCLLACNTRDTAGLATISFSFRNYCS